MNASFWVTDTCKQHCGQCSPERGSVCCRTAPSPVTVEVAGNTQLDRQYTSVRLGGATAGMQPPNCEIL
jgi:hypothetical protein